MVPGNFVQCVCTTGIVVTVLLVTASTDEQTCQCNTAANVTDCSFLNLRTFERNRLLASNCNSIQIDLSNNILQEFPNIESFHYANLAFNDLTSLKFGVESNLQVLDVSYNKLSKIILGEQVTTLQYLRASHNLLRKSKEYFIHGECKLNAIDISNNLLESVEAVTLCAELVTLDASVNRISDLPTNLTTLKNLKRLYLSHNKLVNVYYLPPVLETMDISYNELEAVPDLRVVPNLETLLLSHNMITLVSQNSTMNLNSLVCVDLSGNRLQFIDYSFNWTAEARQLNFSNNFISYVLKEMLELWVRLEELDLSDNKVTVVPTFRQMWELKHISLANNEIENVTFPELDSLLGWGCESRFVDLRGNLLWTNSSDLQDLVRHFNDTSFTPTDSQCACLELTRSLSVLAFCVPFKPSSSNFRRWLLDITGNVSTEMDTIQSCLNFEQNSSTYSSNYSLTILLLTVAFFLSITVLVFVLWSRNSFLSQKNVKIITKFSQVHKNELRAPFYPDSVQRMRRSRSLDWT